MFCIFHFFTISTSFADNTDDKNHLNLIKDISLFNDDGTINVVIEINAGSNEKWEVSDNGDEIIHTLKNNKKE